MTKTDAPAALREAPALTPPVQALPVFSALLLRLPADVGVTSASIDRRGGIELHLHRVPLNVLTAIGDDLGLSPSCLESSVTERYEHWELTCPSYFGHPVRLVTLMNHADSPA